MKVIALIVALLVAYLFGVPLLVMWSLEAAHDQDPRIPVFDYWTTWWLVLAIGIPVNVYSRGS